MNTATFSLKWYVLKSIRLWNPVREYLLWSFSNNNKIHILYCSCSYLKLFHWSNQFLQKKIAKFSLAISTLAPSQCWRVCRWAAVFFNSLHCVALHCIANLWPFGDGQICHFGLFLAILAIIISGQMTKKYWGSWYKSKAHMKTSYIGKTKAYLSRQV